MDARTIERLLIDRKLGELSPEAGELLDAHLALRPDLADLAESVDTTIDSARLALRREKAGFVEAMPPRSKRPGPLFRPPRLRDKAWLRHLAVAAAVALAFLLGNSSGVRWEAPARPHRVMTGRLPSEKDRSGFWSLRRLREAQPRSPTRSRQKVEWTTPLGRPRIGEQT